MSEVAQSATIENALSDTGDSIHDVMRELKCAVEAAATNDDELTDAEPPTDKSDAAWGPLRGILEIVAAVARECSDDNSRVREKLLALDKTVGTLADQLESIPERLVANVKLELQTVVADNQRAFKSITEIYAQLHHLQRDLANWQANKSNEAIENKLEVLNARLQLLEARTEDFAETKSETRRANATLSTLASEVELLFGQLAAASKQVNTATNRLEAFRRHFEQLPD